MFEEKLEKKVGFGGEIKSGKFMNRFYFLIKCIEENETLYVKFV